MEPSVGEVLITWTNQMGHPLVTFRRIDGGARVEVTQKMYLVDPEAPLVERYPTRYEYGLLFHNRSTTRPKPLPQHLNTVSCMVTEVICWTATSITIFLFAVFASLY